MAQWRAWLQRVWAIEQFAAAVEVASPVLARRVATVCREPDRPAREVRRAAVSVTRYLVRAAGRATPFGLFAGVAATRFARSTTVRWGRCHRAVPRVDAAWLDAVLTQLESDRELCGRLRVVANSAATVRDGRLVLGWQRRHAAAGVEGPGEVSVRNTRVVQAVMRATVTPIRLRDAADKVAAEVDAPVSALEPMLAELVGQGLLVTQLRPPMTATEPLTHVVAALDEVEADSVDGVSGPVEQIRALHRDMIGHNGADSARHARECRAGMSHAVTGVASGERPVGMDLRLDCDLALPDAVAREAEAAAAALVRLAPRPFGSPEWQQYHGRFIERYGPQAVVPVTELVADSGLGFPAGYRDAPRRAPVERSLSERDATLMAWAQRAAWQQCREVVLDDDMLAELEVAGGADIAAQPHTELRLCVQAPTRAALDRGEFGLVVAGVSRSAGATTGRFLDLFDTGDQRRFAAAYADLPTVCETGFPAQVSAPALYPRTDNVARSPRVLPAVVSLGEHREPADTTMVPLEDLAVTADAQRLVLLSLSQRRPVEPVMFSAVEMVHHAHPLVRFLTEINTARAAPCAPFSWGHAGRLPFLPRVRYRRTILTPARWRLEPADLPGTTAGWRDWVAGFHQWRERAGVPDTVHVGDNDRRMRLHLHTPAHLSLLRIELERAGGLTVREAPDAEAFGWFDGHTHEVVIPLVSTTSTPSPRWSAHLVGRDHGHLPGSEHWAYVKLYTHPDRDNAVLLGHLPELLSAWDREPEWWFLRYHDPDPHLRLRIRLRDPDEATRTAAEINRWVAGLRERGLVGRAQFDTYHPETGRFGTDAAMEAAESVFAADSRAVLAQLRTLDRDAVPGKALAAASMVNLACSFHDAPDGGMRWLIDHARTPSGPAPERTLREAALRLADPHGDWAAVRALPGGGDLSATWQDRRRALAAYRRALEGSGRPEPAGVLADLLHLHHVRMAGVAVEDERACLRLARAAALRWNARTGGQP
ncbi:lantibiotic dehydratase [Saccharomonospora iraqiensis]|uniref:lantibiotic dehydratase n=1 Tax=Saccharomonospora iraqiensis TaxID=52698 RepID=UPI0002FA2FD4|nr:lantibiotic dehydratase [Saccharomonospora iraqiensis]